MWKGTPEFEDLLRSLKSSGEKKKREDASTDEAATDVPDLFAKNDNLSGITQVRDAVRSLRREARKFDAELELSGKNCDVDICRYCLMVCGRIIGGRERELSDIDRSCLEQVLGLQIDPAEFTTISTELRSRSGTELDSILPELFRRTARADHRMFIFDPTDSLIRHIETIAKSTGRVYGDKHGNRARMAALIGLKLRSLIDAERERPSDAPATANDSGADEAPSAEQPQTKETLEDIKGADGPHWPGSCETGLHVHLESVTCSSAQKTA